MILLFDDFKRLLVIVSVPNYFLSGAIVIRTVQRSTIRGVAGVHLFPVRTYKLRVTQWAFEYHANTITHD